MTTLRALAGYPEHDNALAKYAGVVPSKITAWKRAGMRPTMNVFGILLESIGHDKTVLLFLAALEAAAHGWLLLIGQVAQPLFFILGVVTILGVAFWAFVYESYPDYDLRTALAFTYALSLLVSGAAVGLVLLTR